MIVNVVFPSIATPCKTKLSTRYAFADDRSKMFPKNKNLMSVNVDFPIIATPCKTKITVRYECADDRSKLIHKMVEFHDSQRCFS